jgi:hypothetical protein
MADIEASPSPALTPRKQPAVRPFVNAGPFVWLLANLYLLWRLNHMTAYAQGSHFARNYAIVYLIAALWFLAPAVQSRRFTIPAKRTSESIKRLRLLVISASAFLMIFGALLLYSSVR